MSSATKLLAKCLKPVLPRSIYDQMSATYNVLWREAHPYRDRRWRDSSRRLRELHDRHQGQRCVIIGNGPSLNHTDLSLLKGTVTFGLNRIYLLFDQVHFEPTYHVTVNRLVIEQCGSELSQLNMPRFIPWSCRDLMPSHKNLMYLQDLLEPTFSTDVVRGVWQGHTVTYVAMQLAFYMGFSEVLLVGVDHNFASQGKPNEQVTSEGPDPNHFHADYFGKGFRWQLPDLEASELAYRMAKYMYLKRGRTILDATIGGKLEVFPKVDYHQFFQRESATT